MRSLVVAALLFAAQLACCAHDADDHFRVKCETTKGPFVIEVIPEWAPIGARRFLELVLDGFYTDIAFFRCVRGFLTQFGISDKKEKKHWHRATIPDDASLNRPISKHIISYAGGGPNTRSTQLFIAFEDLDFLGKEPWEVPFGRIVEGADTLRKLYTGYGDIPPFGKGPDQLEIHAQGNAYIHDLFPKIDFLKKCELMAEEEEEGKIAELKYRPIEGDDAAPAPRPHAPEEEEEEEEEEDVEEEPALETNRKASSGEHSHSKGGNIEAYYSLKAKHHAEYNAQLRRVSEEQIRAAPGALILRALFVLVTGLLLMFVVVRLQAPHLLTPFKAQ